MHEITRKKHTGEPGNGGEFSHSTHAEADVELTDTTPVGVHEDYEEIVVFDHFGSDIHVSTEPDEPAKERFQVWGDPIAVEFWREDDTPYSETWLRRAAVTAYDGALLERLNAFKLSRPDMATMIDAEMEKVRARLKGSNGLTVPQDWDGQYKLTPASSQIGNRLDCNEYLAHPDSAVNARCDYAEIGETGIAYGVNLPASLIGEIVAGEQSADESDDDYFTRVAQATPDDADIDRFFQEKYGASVLDAGDYGDISVEFFVEYGPEGPKGTSIESMGDRAETETKLLNARNDWEYSGHMQSALAEHLGYHSEGILDDSGIWVGSRWVRDDVALAA